MKKILFLVTREELTNAPKHHVITLARDREQAKRDCKPQLGGNPDYYVVTPIKSFKDEEIIEVRINRATLWGREWEREAATKGYPA